MYGLLPRSALHDNASTPPELHDLLHHQRVTQGIILTVEEQRWCCDRRVVENLDTAFVDVSCVRLEQPEIQ